MDEYDLFGIDNRFSDLNQVRKLDDVIEYSKKLESTREALEKREKEIKDFLDVVKLKQELLKTNVKKYMLENGVEELSGDLFRYRLSKSKDAILIDKQILPEKYKIIISESVPDRAKIEEAISNGETVEGVTVDKRYALRIYPNIPK
jgi:hypothetical protein